MVDAGWSATASSGERWKEPSSQNTCGSSPLRLVLELSAVFPRQGVPADIKLFLGNYKVH